MNGEEAVARLTSLAVGVEHYKTTAEEGDEFDALRVDVAQRLDAYAAARKAANAKSLQRPKRPNGIEVCVRADEFEALLEALGKAET